MSRVGYDNSPRLLNVAVTSRALFDLEESHAIYERDGIEAYRAYQFAHEFCHILCNFDDDWKGNNWFEETMCETSSLFVLRRLSKEWEERPPYPAWK